MSVIIIENLSKSFGSVKALDGIELTVKQGEVFGYIGPNGAGKTTTIRTVLGILKADEGNITVFGKDAWKDAVEIHKRIAFVPGDVSLWPNLTGGEVIDLFAKLKKVKKQPLRDELLERFDLDPTKKCRTYSKGNRQKVALVAALSTESDLLVLDEPTSGLDPLMEKIFQEYVLRLKKEGKTIFLSSHILSEVEKLCDRVAIIREGKIIEKGSLKDLRHLMRNQIVVETNRPVEGFDNLSGIYDLKIDGTTMHFQADLNRLAEIIKHIYPYDIINFESQPPNLEDLFMHHYAGNGGRE